MNYRKIIKEEIDDFQWMVDIPAGDLHRYFDVNVCYINWYNEETGEDECVSGGSYFIKIPVDVVPNIWDLTVGDYGGPGDEGEGVIQWLSENGLLDDTSYDCVEYVMEIDKKEYCEAWGDYKVGDKTLCGK